MGKQEEEEERETLALRSCSLLKWEMRKKGSLISKWGVGSTTNNLIGLKSWLSRLLMNSTKKRKAIVELSSFQKVYVSRVLGISSFGYRFLCVMTVLPSRL